MPSSPYLRFKILSSFAIAALFAVAFVRLAASVPHSSTAMLALGTCAIVIVAGTWRGLIYLRAARRRSMP